MLCPTALLAKLINSMDYRSKGTISLPVTLCNAISLTTHLILGCNSPLRTITSKVVSRDCGGSGSAEPGASEPSGPGLTGMAEPAGRGQQPGSARSRAAGLEQNGEGGYRQNSALTAELGFWSPAGSYFVSKGEEGSGQALGIPFYTLALPQLKECPQLVTGLQLGQISART